MAAQMFDGIREQGARRRARTMVSAACVTGTCISIGWRLGDAGSAGDEGPQPGRARRAPVLLAPFRWSTRHGALLRPQPVGVFSRQLAQSHPLFEFSAASDGDDTLLPRS